jgi:FdhE protein
MSQESQRSQMAVRIERAVDKTKEELPSLEGLLEAFKHILVATALFKADLVQDESFVMPEPDGERFRQGVPLAGPDAFHASVEQLTAAANKIGPAIAKGFPRVAPAVTAIAQAIEQGDLNTEQALSCLLGGKEEDTESRAEAIRVDPSVLTFVLGLFLKPFVEKRAELMGPIAEGFFWSKGYCPICGSWPSVSFLKGKEGQRWLKCSFCGHEWRFIRTQCPFCENEDQDQLELLYSADREGERVETCHRCRRYIVAIDLRDRADEAVMEVVPLGLVYLDVLAQQQGFQPGALTHWNVIG